MSVGAGDSSEQKGGEVDFEGMEDVLDPQRMVSKLQAMGNDTMVKETIKRQQAMLDVFLAWIEDNYGINVCFLAVLDFFFRFLWFFLLLRFEGSEMRNFVFGEKNE